MKQNFFKHESVIIDKNVIIGDKCKIWHWTHVSSGAKIGSTCILGQNVFIGANVLIGNNCKIQNNVSIYEGVELENDVFCGPSMVFTNVINPRSFVERKKEFKKTLVKKGATIGANATILCGTTIGCYAMIGAGSVVLDDIKDFAIMVGNPAKQKGWISKMGVKLDLPIQGAGFATCSESKEKYKLNGTELEMIK
jgi:UDP-2-acetamido-3-amino-2,3-dideoxy-glucuronate N-acetyltransferase